MNYQYDHQNAILKNLPPVLRKSKLAVFLYALVEPLRVLYTQFLTFRSETIAEAKLNSQQMILEKILNDRFDPEFERVKVFTDDASRFKINAYLQSEGPVIDVDLQGEDKRMEAYKQDDFSSADFTISHPFLNEAELSVIIDKYKLASKTYQFIEEL